MILSIILTIICNVAKIFPYSNVVIIFLWLFLFCTSMLGMAIWWSTLFDNPKAASMLSIVILMLAVYSGYFGTS